jgi:conjugal transfer pilus assembly protein TraW
MIKILILILAIITGIQASQVPSFAKVIGTDGATYPIVEKDALSEVEEAAARVDWSKMFNDGAKNNQALKLQIDPLPIVAKTSVRTIKMSYTLEEDMPNPQDPTTTLYPKGFTFNPLDYSILPGKLVFIDGSNKDQVAWAKSLKDDSAMVIVTGGDYNKVGAELKTIAYNADQKLIDMFKIKAVPTIVTQKGSELQVEEVVVARNNNSH